MELAPSSVQARRTAGGQLMTDQEIVIELEPDDTQGHATLRVTDDEGWLKDRLGREPGSNRITLKASDDDDVEGHAMSSTVTLRAFDDDDDTEGHAISVHFPSRDEAEAFRRRLMLTGVLAGTIALGAAGGIGLANLADSPDAASGAAVTTQVGPMDAHEAPAFQAAAGAATQAGPLDAHEAPAFQEPAAGMDWTQVERPGTATGGDEAADLQTDKGRPAPR
jgi:hypothetical protein